MLRSKSLSNARYAAKCSRSVSVSVPSRSNSKARPRDPVVTAQSQRIGKGAESARQSPLLRSGMSQTHRSWSRQQSACSLRSCTIAIPLRGEQDMATEKLIAFGPEIWVAEGPVVTHLGFDYPTRMAIIRLADGGLFLWSPTKLTPGLQATVE